MPRTKRVKNVRNNNNNNNVDLLALKEHFQSIFEQRQRDLHEYLQDCRKEVLNSIKTANLKIPAKYMNMTMAQLKRIEAGETSVANSTVSSLNQTASRSRRPPLAHDDEGYLTAGSNSSTSSRRRRSRSVQPRTAPRTFRKSRSSSRTSKTVEPFKTPMHQGVPPQFVGTITPKVKPNTPQCVLRWPKQGEMAVSMQGSPLMVGGVIADSTAHVNIPLDNGSVLALQPHNGFRVSELPELDENVRRQLQLIRDNLSKICQD